MNRLQTAFLSSAFELGTQLGERRRSDESETPSPIPATTPANNIRFAMDILDFSIHMDLVRDGDRIRLCSNLRSIFTSVPFGPTGPSHRDDNRKQVLQGISCSSASYATPFCLRQRASPWLSSQADLIRKGRCYEIKWSVNCVLPGRCKIGSV
jgi:hypothetical protein